MKTYVALFRGINVGGRNRLPMEGLRSLLEDLGATDVRTYIQSGNAIFGHEGDPARLAEELRTGVEGRFDFAPHVLILERDELEAALDNNPFPEAESEPKNLHLFFLASSPGAPDMEGIEAMRVESERFALVDRVFYLHTPDGIGRSKLAANAEKLLDVPATARNLRTVRKIVEMTERF